MASFALGTAGTAVAGPVGGLIGTLLGSYIDQTVIAPALEGSDDSLIDVGLGPTIQVSTGSVLPYLFGGNDPNGGNHSVGGIVLWSSDPYPITTAGGSGSNKRGGATPPTVTWYADVLFGFAGNYCAGIDRLYADGELVLNRAPEPPPFTLEFRRTDSEPVGVVIDFESVQQFTPLAAGAGANRYTFHWNLVLKNDRDSSGQPRDPVLAAILGRIQLGDDVGLLFDQLGEPQRFSRKWLADTLGVALTDGSGLPYTRYRCVYRLQDPNGNVEIQLNLAPAEFYFPILDTNTLPTGVGYVPGEAGRDFSDPSQTPFDPNWSGLGILDGNTPPIPSTNYPFPDTGAVGTLSFYTRRNQWKREALRNTSPVYGIDWLVWNGQDSDVFPDAETSTTGQPALLTDAENGGQIENPVGFATMPRIAVKGLNLSSFGNRMPNVTADLRESDSACIVSVLQELMGMAGVDASQIDTRLAVLDAEGIATTSTPLSLVTSVTSGNYSNLEGQNFLTVETDSGGALQWARGNQIRVATSATDPFPADASEHIYRVVDITQASGWTNRYQVIVSPRLKQTYNDGTKFLANQFRSAFAPFSTMRVEGRTNIAQAIETALVIYDMELQDVAGFLRPRLANRETWVDTIDATQIQPLPLQAQRGDPIPLEDSATQTVAASVSVRYTSAWAGGEVLEADYTLEDDEIPEARTSENYVPPSASVRGLTTQRYDFRTHVMTGAVADALAKRLAQLVADGRQRGELVLTHKYLHYQEGDILRIGTIPAEFRTDPLVDRYHDREFVLRIVRMVQGNDATVTIEFTLFSDSFTKPPAPVLEPPAGGVGGTASNPIQFVPSYVPPGSITTLSPTLATLSVMADESTGRPGAYIAGISPGRGTGRVKASVFRSVDDAEDYRALQLTAESVPVSGQVTGGTALSSAPAHGVFDYASTINVRLYDGALETVTEDQAMGGANFAQIGNELVCFTTATLQADGTYDVTGFRRGLWGTHTNVDQGTGYDSFVLLGNEYEPIPFTFVPLTAADIGRDVHLRLTTAGQDVDGAPTITARDFQGWNARPLPPVNVKWARVDSSTGDVNFTWDRQPRVRWSEFGSSAVPRYDTTDLWTIEVYNTSGDLLRTETDQSGMAWTYTAARQSADGLAGKTFAVKVYRQGTYGNSRANELTVTSGTYLGSSDY